MASRLRFQVYEIHYHFVAAQRCMSLLINVRHILFEYCSDKRDLEVSTAIWLSERISLLAAWGNELLSQARNLKVVVIPLLLDFLQFGNMSPAVEELVRTASYSQFQQIVNENIGNDTGWEQIALMFRLTQTSIQLAGMGTAVALQMKEMTLKYFEDKFAAWLVGKGGWESMVEETNTELDSELD